MAFFGICCARKGQDIFIDAVKKLPSEIRNRCCFKIVGNMKDDPFCESLRQQAQNEKKYCFCRAVAAYKITSRNESNGRRCLFVAGRSNADCLYGSGVARQSCSNHTGTASLIKDWVNGYIFRTEQDDLSQIMVKAFADKDKLAEMGKLWHKIYTDNFTEQLFKKNIDRIFMNKQMS